MTRERRGARSRSRVAASTAVALLLAGLWAFGAVTADAKVRPPKPVPAWYMTAGNVTDGTSCGTNMVCNSGTCGSCTSGASCTPSNPCDTGTVSCKTGTAKCVDTGNAVPDGTSCGPDGLVCNSGGCVSCKAGGTCARSNPCETGTISCSTGSPKCVANGSQPAGTVCGVASCPVDTLITPTCDGSGTCGASMNMPCASGMCLPDGSACSP